MNAWDNLPNAKHIDWALASVKANPDVWVAEWNEARRGAWDTAYAAVRITARRGAWDTAWGTAWDTAWGTAWDAAWGAIAALVAFDHCEKYLKMTPEELTIWWKLSDDPACVLLIPMVKVKNECMG
jgi:hypothetical protein